MQEAISGRLVPQDPNDEPANDIYLQCIERKKSLLKSKSISKRDFDVLPITEDDLDFTIPESWVWIRLGDLFSHSTGKALNGADKRGTLQNYITTSNVYWNDFRLEKLRQMYYTESDKERCLATKGDLLVLEGGDVGRAAIWDKDYDIFLQNHIHKLRAYVPVCTKFFYYCFYLFHDTGIIGGKGIGIQGLSSGVLHQVILPLPPLAEQKRIVAKLEELLPIVEQYGKAQTELDQLNTALPIRLRQSILQEAISGRLVPQDASEESIEVLVDQIAQSKKNLVKEGQLKEKDTVVTPIPEDELPFEIPSTWRWFRLGELAFEKMGKTPPRGDSQFWANGKYPWVSISDMKDYGHVAATKESVSEIAAQKAFRSISPAGSLLMSFKLTVGRTSILDIDAYHNEAIITIKPYYDRDNAFRNYLFYILPLVANLGDSKDAIKGKTLNSTSLYNLMIPLPPIEEQKRIVAKIEEVFPAIKF